MARLSDAEVQRYRDDGVVVPEYRLPAACLAELRAALERVIARNPGVRPEHLVSAHITGRSGEGVRGDAAFLHLARDPEIGEMIAQLIGEDVILWGCQAFCKPAGDGMEVPWHQDGHYWPIRPLATCTLWLALDDSTVENGCLRVIPGSHRGARLHPHLKEERDDVTLNQRVAAEDFDEAAAHDVELAAGQMSLHDIYMIHGSNPNRSAKRRAGLAIRYMPATSHFDRGLFKPSAAAGYHVDFSNRPLWPVRGVDRCAKNDFGIGHAAPVE